MSLQTTYKYDTMPNPLRDLEAVIALAQFAILAGEGYSDPWALSGIGVRIAVDLGLHKSAEPNHQRRLFWSVYILDRRASVAHDLPVRIPDDAITIEVRKTPVDVNNLVTFTDPFTMLQQPSTGRPHLLEFYRLFSDIYCAKAPVTAHWCNEMIQKLNACFSLFSENTKPSPNLETERQYARKRLTELGRSVGDDCIIT
jgi:hypothetical protein